jgi:Arylsulfotransferase (ASST)
VASSWLDDDEWARNLTEPQLSRRGFLGRSAAAVGALALPRSAAARLRSSNIGGSYATFLTEPFRIPTLAVSTLAKPSAGLIFVATLNGPGQRGPMIVDNHGMPVWFRPVKGFAINFRTQFYRGRPVLTWWEGQATKIGTSEGVNVILDQRYRKIAQVGAGNGYRADVHEFVLTPNGTALLTVHAETQADLTSVGGPPKGNVLDSIVQEIDVATGKVLFEWHSLDHVPLTETYAPVVDPFDYFHVNSIAVDGDGNLVISARNTSAVYKLHRQSGEVLWRLGGRRSDFALDPGAGFFYQHDARPQPDGSLTLFDDGNGQPSYPARGLVLRLDVPGRRCSLIRAFPHPTPLAVNSMGNAQLLPGGGMMVGFGDQPYLTEFGADGTVRLDAKFTGGAWNYRAFRDPWVGRPHTLPAVAVRRSGRDAVAYASWNGSTETAYWRVRTGRTLASLRSDRVVSRTGFETSIRLHGVPRVLTVTALDRKRNALATSKAVHPFV